MARVVIMQPYVPAYRVALFSTLAARLAEQGHELVIAAGEPAGAQASRADAAEVDGVLQQAMPVRTLRIGNACLRLVNGRSAWKNADVVVAELAAGASATYGALFQRTRPVGVWGHVGAFTAPETRVVRALRRWQTRAADHVLAYTDTGAALAQVWGADSSRVTSLHNTMDLAGLASAIKQVGTQSEVEVRGRLGLGPGPVFAMIGGLDASKRVDLVVEALDRLWTSRPDLQLVVGGRGELEDAFARAASRGQVRMLGYIGNTEKAELASVAIALLNPGRIGLIAVESMAMRLPIITTTGTRHGPEYEYLTPGADSIESAPTAVALASAMTELADDPMTVARLSSALGGKSETYTLDNMVERYLSALGSLLERTKKRSPHSEPSGLGLTPRTKEIPEEPWH